MELSHDRLQQDLFIYIRNEYQAGKTVWHTPNELAPYPGESKHAFIKRCSMRKAIGVTSGVTDLVWYRKGVLHVFDIKLPGDRISEDQRKFIDQIEEQGGKFYEINTLEQGKLIIDKIATT